MERIWGVGLWKFAVSIRVLLLMNTYIKGRKVWSRWMMM
jgi:hypothetical protein